MKINKLCLYFLIILAGVILPRSVKADSVKIYTSTIPTNNYLYVGSGDRNLNFETDNVYYYMEDLPRYFLITMCTSSERIYNTSIVSSGGYPTLDSFSVLNTNYSCTFPTSSGVTGHLVYFTGTYNVAYNCGATGTNCTQKGSVTINVPNNSSWTLLAYQNSIESISIDYATNTIVTQNQSIISQQSAINSSIISMQNSIDAAKNQAHQDAQQAHQDAQQAHTDAQNTQNTIKDDNVDSPNSSITTIKNSLATNGVITSLVVLPVTLYQAILNSVNGSCATFSLGSLFGTNLTIPCINVANYLGTTLWGSIDVIISGIFIYMISRKMVKVFNQLSSLKEGDVLDG